jgi:hypothetical protein
VNRVLVAMENINFKMNGHFSDYTVVLLNIQLVLRVCHLELCPFPTFVKNIPIPFTE